MYNIPGVGNEAGVPFPIALETTTLMFSKLLAISREPSTSMEQLQASLVNVCSPNMIVYHTVFMIVELIIGGS